MNIIKDIREVQCDSRQYKKITTYINSKGIYQPYNQIVKH